METCFVFLLLSIMNVKLKIIIFSLYVIQRATCHSSSFTFVPSKKEFDDIFSPIWKQLQNHKNLAQFGISSRANFAAIKEFLLERYEAEYSSPCQCGRRNDITSPTKIVQGKEALPNEFPWQAVILFQSRLACGGTLISSKWILTAEHCFRNPITHSELPHTLFEVILGKHNVTVLEEAERRFNISRLVRHPNYSILDRNPQFDFSLIELPNIIKFTREISPACLPRDDSENFAGAEVIASGFGQLEFNGRTPKVLNYAKLKVLDNEKCGQNKNILGHHLCASGIDEFGDISDTCQGDSGGPLVTDINGGWTLIGVTSYGEKCAETDFPGVYARVSSVLQWIYGHTQLDSCALERALHPWSAWSTCTGPCNSNDGVKIRKRICKNSVDCRRDAPFEAATCTTEECPLDAFSKLMVIGGRSADHDVEIVDLSGRNLNCSKPPNFPTPYGATGLFFDGFPTACGGWVNFQNLPNCSKYDFESDAWIAGPNMDTDRHVAASVLISNDEWWVTGGYYGTDRVAGETSAVLKAGETQFSEYVDMPENIRFHSVLRVNDNFFVFAGNNDRVSRKVYVFDRSRRAFSGLPLQREGRNVPQSGLIRRDGTDILVVAGGEDKDRTRLKSVEMLDLKTLLWSRGPDLPQPLCKGTTVAYKNTFLIIGGFGDSGPNDLIYEYDIDLDSWRTRRERLKKGRFETLAFLIPDHVANCTDSE